MKKLFIITFLSVSLIACKKESMVCYTSTDMNGNILGHVCGSSENDVFNQVKGSTIGGVTIYTITDFRTYFHKD